MAHLFGAKDSHALVCPLELWLRAFMLRGPFVVIKDSYYSMSFLELGLRTSAVRCAPLRCCR